jgi:hypothetical protein
MSAVARSCSVCALDESQKVAMTTSSSPSGSIRTSRVFWLPGATALVLLPKCPFCLVGWLGALGLAGFANHAAAIPLGVLVLFCASQAVVLVSMRRTGEWRSSVAALLGATVIVVAYALEGPSLLRWLGMGLLIAASIFNAIATAHARERRSRENAR